MIERNVSLKPYNTFGIDVKADRFISIKSVSELEDLFKTVNSDELFILGGGSNLLLTGDIKKLVAHIDLKGIQVISEDDEKVIIEAAAGENWHDLVLWCIDHGYGGIENLSLIPGNAGTAPIQNIGAYGVELKDVFKSCELFDIESKSIKTYTYDDCQFDYRNSVFKQQLKNKVIICSIWLELTKKNHNTNTSYGAINSELEKRGISNPTIKDISDVVIQIRQSKLPDPKEIGNSGSFFKNPVISEEHYIKLEGIYGDIPNYPAQEGMLKVPAGWLIEKAGFKGKRFGDFGVHKNQALVLVNYGGADGKDIKELSELIQNTISRLFEINLEAEVNII